MRVRPGSEGGSRARGESSAAEVRSIRDRRHGLKRRVSHADRLLRAAPRVRDPELLPATHDGGLHEEGASGGRGARVQPEAGEVGAEAARGLVAAGEAGVQPLGGGQARPLAPDAEQGRGEESEAPGHWEDGGGGEDADCARGERGEWCQQGVS